MTDKTNYKNDYNADMAELIKKCTTAMTDSKQTRIKEPEVYDGTRDALIIDGWIRSIERFTTFNSWTPERSSLYATTLLRDRADAWFRTIELTDEAPTTWLELKRLITEFFRPDNSTRIARDKLASLKQTGDLVNYINEFMDVKLAIPTMTDEEGCDKFIRGLTSKMMRSHIRQYDADTLKQAIQAALAFDSAQQEENYSYIPRSSHVKTRIDDPMDLDVAEEINYVRNDNYGRGNNNGYSRNDNNNFSRGNNGNYSRNNGNNYGRNNGNYNSRNGNNNFNSNTSCYYCHKSGHIKRNCRTRLSDIKKLDDQHSKRDFQSM
ncbi:hypothetical protein INT47_004675 [Mucor saturninus]|uniref:CCHC-type domain-containing protein n=1 Tax=Mucor saturninus TaxID=64648 RepID=A0A8H7QKW4_9FUNG|nr:hypothetical protein INT47_004675 [Mucor saturninus]